MNGSIQNFDWSFHLLPLMFHWFYLESIQGVSSLTFQYFEGFIYNPHRGSCQEPF